MKTLKHIIIFIIFVLPGLTFSSNLMYAVDKNGAVEVDAHGVCKKVSTTGNNKYLIPVKTSVEWKAFRDHKPSDVSLAECGGGGGSNPPVVSTEEWVVSYERISAYRIYKAYKDCRNNGGSRNSCAAGNSSGTATAGRWAQVCRADQDLNCSMRTNKVCEDVCGAKNKVSASDSAGNSCATYYNRPTSLVNSGLADGFNLYYPNYRTIDNLELENKNIHIKRHLCFPKNSPPSAPPSSYRCTVIDGSNNNQQSCKGPGESIADVIESFYQLGNSTIACYCE